MQHLRHFLSALFTPRARATDVRRRQVSCAFGREDYPTLDKQKGRE
jgi:hypothetical protein